MHFSSFYIFNQKKYASPSVPRSIPITNYGNTSHTALSIHQENCIHHSLSNLPDFLKFLYYRNNYCHCLFCFKPIQQFLLRAFTIYVLNTCIFTISYFLTYFNCYFFPFILPHFFPLFLLCLQPFTTYLPESKQKVRISHPFLPYTQLHINCNSSRRNTTLTSTPNNSSSTVHSSASGSACKNFPFIPLNIPERTFT